MIILFFTIPIFFSIIDIIILLLQNAMLHIINIEILNKIKLAISLKKVYTIFNEVILCQESFCWIVLKTK